ncbi:hypothetical protein VTO42DRAFT_2210 [Malbranchea cinnamomea]
MILQPFFEFCSGSNAKLAFLNKSTSLLLLRNLENSSYYLSSTTDLLTPEYLLLCGHYYYKCLDSAFFSLLHQSSLLRRFRCGNESRIEDLQHFIRTSKDAKPDLHSGIDKPICFWTGSHGHLSHVCNTRPSFWLPLARIVRTLSCISPVGGTFLAPIAPSLIKASLCSPTVAIRSMCCSHTVSSSLVVLRNWSQRE